MKRGEVWIVAGGKDYAGKPRPAVILQDDRFDMTNSITICAFIVLNIFLGLFDLIFRWMMFIKICIPIPAPPSPPPSRGSG